MNFRYDMNERKENLQSEKMISVIGVNYLYPISTLIEARSSFHTIGPNEVQAARWDNGFAVSLIVLNVLLLESIINRVKYINKIAPSMKPIVFIEETKWTKIFYERLLEVFVVRDVIAHNHIWEAEFIWNDEFDMKLIEAHVIDGYGDKKFKTVLDQGSRKTRILGLNLFPTRINWNDFRIVMKEVLCFIQETEKQDQNYFRISNEFVKYRNNDYATYFL